LILWNGWAKFRRVRMMHKQSHSVRAELVEAFKTF
jgi:hypothetical protein